MHFRLLTSMLVLAPLVLLAGCGETDTAVDDGVGYEANRPVYEDDATDLDETEAMDPDAIDDPAATPPIEDETITPPAETPEADDAETGDPAVEERPLDPNE